MNSNTGRNTLTLPVCYHNNTGDGIINMNILIKLTILLACVAGDNIEDVGVKLSPDKCSDDISLVIVIHSHPQHHQLRNVLRGTWARETDTIFLIMKHSWL